MADSAGLQKDQQDADGDEQHGMSFNLLPAVSPAVAFQKMMLILPRRLRLFHLRVRHRIALHHLSHC
jgi:hypothetical protein